MLNKKLAEQAIKEYSLPESVIRQGGINGRPFWNTQATQFTFAPAFDLSPVPTCGRYLFEAVGSDGKTLSFEGKKPTEPLCPIWNDLPAGQVSLIVTALNDDGSRFNITGARTFHKCSPFTGNYPPKVRSYRKTARMALDYAFEMPSTQYWLTNDKPDPEYWLYLYPTKVISALIPAMLDYEKLRPDRGDAARKIAVKSADYLISISEPKDAALEGMPPTYFWHGEGEVQDKDIAARYNQNMLIYPCHAGVAYLKLYDVTNDKKYYDAAIAISNWYRDNVYPNGSWPLMVYLKDGKPSVPAYCLPFEIESFLRQVYDRVGDNKLLEIIENCDKYSREVCLKNFNWEGQFEDAPVSAMYSNMAHFGARQYLHSAVTYYSDNTERIAEAEECMRYIEDQFVFWDKKPISRHQWNETSLWHVPCGLEQYAWYVPIDDSTAEIMVAFAEIYKATGKELYLEKAKALGDSITNMQNPRNGLIPTHWFNPEKDIEDGGSFWLNCLLETADCLTRFSDILKE